MTRILELLQGRSAEWRFATTRTDDTVSARREPREKSPAPDPSEELTIDDVLSQDRSRDLRRLPVLIGEAFQLVWAAAPRQLTAAAALQISAGVSLALQLVLLRRILDAVLMLERTPDIAAIIPELLLLGVLLLLVAVAALAQREQQRTLAEMVEKYASGRVMDVSTQVDLIEYDRPAFYDRLQRARINASSRPVQISNGVIGLLASGATVAAVGAALVWLEPIVAIVIVSGGFPALVFNRLASRALHAHSVRQTAGDRRRAYLYEVLSRKESAQEIRAFDSSEHLRAEHDRLYDAKIDDLRATVRKRMLYGTINAAVTAIVTVGSMTLLLAFVQLGRLELSDAAIAVGAVVILAARLKSLVASSGSLYEGALFLRDFTDFAAIRPQLDAVAEARETAAGRAAPPVAFERLALDRVSFTYPSRTEPSLRDVSLSIRHGEVIALVGENGSGKTTLTKLLAGLYRPTHGAVLWDDRDVSTYELAELREHVTLIFQDFARYFLSAHENIGISRIRDLANRAGVEQAAAQAGAAEFLASLPSGYGTLLGPAFLGGSDLSTGQWQRIALARAYFRESPMLILDEPTASLDPRGEYEIFQQVRRLAEGHTVVLVSHRFSSVRAADRILVLNGGRIVEEGSHDQLLELDGLYAELFGIQAKGYRPTPS